MDFCSRASDDYLLNARGDPTIELCERLEFEQDDLLKINFRESRNQNTKMRIPET